MNELYIPKERVYRNCVNGRFLKGNTPGNKGKKMQYKSEDSRARALHNLAIGRQIPRKTYSGNPKKEVVLIKDRILVRVFSSVNHAARWLGVTPSHVSDVCLKKKHHNTVRGYKAFFENDNWLNEIDNEH